MKTAATLVIIAFLLTACASKEDALIDFSENPLGAIGLVLSAVAAGIDGRPSPIDALRRQRLEEERLELQRGWLELQRQWREQGSIK